MDIQDFKLHFPNGPASPKQLRRELNAMETWLNKLVSALRGESSGGGPKTNSLNPSSVVPSGGAPGLKRGEIVYFVSPDFVALADRTLGGTKPPMGVVRSALTAGRYEILLGPSGGFSFVRCDSSVTGPSPVMLSDTPGVAEAASEALISALPSGSALWMIGVTTGAASSGLAETILDMRSSPAMMV